jgi:hypothetical protein
MRTVETNQIIDVAQHVGEVVRRQLGGALHIPALSMENRAYTYNGMVPYPANPNILVVPTNQNMQSLAASAGVPFGLLVGRRIRPAVITPRSTANLLDVAYLIPPPSVQGTAADFDQINPRNPVISATWPMFLKQAAAVQDRRVGVNHDPLKAMGRELGHSVLATVALKRPEVLSAGHAVHGWTDSQQGIAGAVTDRSIGLYDFRLRDGDRHVGEQTTTITAADTAYLLKIPELDQAMRELEGLSAADLTVGLGLVAVQSQIQVNPAALQSRLMATMGRL